MSNILCKNQPELKKRKIQGHDFTALILCGGYGSRIESITKNKPKHLLSTSHQKNIIDFPISQALGAGITNFIFAVTNHTYDKIQDYISQNETTQGTNTMFSVQSRPIGVLDAIDKATKNQTKLKNIVLFHGDEILSNLQIKNLLKFHSDHPNDLTCVSTSNISHGEYFLVETNPNSSIVKKVSKKQAAKVSVKKHCITGTFVFSSKVFRKVMGLQPKTWGEFIDFSVDLGLLHTYKTTSHFFNINSPKDLYLLQAHLKNESMS